MNAVTEPVGFTLPKKPRVKEKDPPPDQRKVAVTPIRAVTDNNLTDSTYRALALVCTYCNRAGITWVSQKRLSEDAQMSQQAISKHIVKLVKLGYIEIVRKGYRAQRSTTIRVIYDKTVDTETAIAITNSIEDTTPPAMKHEQAQQIDPVGQRRVAQLVAKALKPVVTKKEYSMPSQGDTLAVKKIKEGIAKKKAPKGQSSTTSEVVSKESPKAVDNSLHSQPQRLYESTTPEVVHNTNNEHSQSLYKEYLSKDLLNELKIQGVDKSEVIDNLPHLLDAYKAEGLTPTGKQLVEGLIQMHRTNQ